MAPLGAPVVPEVYCTWLTSPDVSAAILWSSSAFDCPAAANSAHDARPGVEAPSETTVLGPGMPFASRARLRPPRSPSASTTRTPARATRAVASTAVYRVLTGTTEPPANSTASDAMAHSGVLGA